MDSVHFRIPFTARLFFFLFFFTILFPSCPTRISVRLIRNQRIKYNYYYYLSFLFDVLPASLVFPPLFPSFSFCVKFRIEHQYAHQYANNDVRFERKCETEQNISFDIVCRTRSAEGRGNGDWIDYRGISKIKFL